MKHTSQLPADNHKSAPLKLIHKIFGISLLILVSMGQLQRIEVLPISFYLHDLLIGCWLMIFFFDRKSNQHLVNHLKKWQDIPKKSKALLLFLSVWILLGWSWQWLNSGFSHWPLLYTLRLVAFVSIAYFLGFTEQLQTKAMTLAYTVFFNLILIFGWLQLIFLPDTRFLFILGWDDHYYRMLGTQFDPNFFGLLLTLAFWWYLASFQKTKNSLFLLASLISSFALTFTWSRSSYLAFLTAIVFSWLFWRPKLINKKIKIFSAFISIFLIISVLLVPKPAGEGGRLNRTSTIDSRVGNTTQSLSSLVGIDLFLGQGLFAPPERLKNLVADNQLYHPKQSDNLLLTILEGIGLGGIFLLSSLLFTQRQAITLKIKNSLSKSEIPISAITLISILIHSLFNNSLLQPFILITWLGIVIIKNRKQ